MSAPTSTITASRKAYQVLWKFRFSRHKNNINAQWKSSYQRWTEPHFFDSASAPLKSFVPHPLLLRKSLKYSSPSWHRKIPNSTVTYVHVAWRFCLTKANACFVSWGKTVLELFCLWMNMISWSSYMTSSERMTYLVDHDISNGSVRDAWMNFVMVSVLASFWQLLFCIDGTAV